MWTAAGLRQFGGHLQPPHGISPHTFEGGAYRAERLAPDPIQPPLTGGAAFHEAGVEQHLQLQGDGAERNVWHRSGAGAGRPLPCPQRAQDLLPPGRRKGGQGAVGHDDI